MAEVKNVSKMAAVRQALKEMGKGAMPVDIQTFVKDKYGHDMTTAHVSNYKTEILRKKSGKGSRTMMKRLGGKSALKRASQEIPAGNGQPGISLGDIETVKGLVSRVGGSDLKSLIEMFGR